MNLKIKMIKFDSMHYLSCSFSQWKAHALNGRNLMSSIQWEAMIIILGELLI